MATIKISDLSVGDWVRIEEECSTISSIYHNGAAYADEVALARNWICTGVKLVSELHPIPITAEMLERNGFERSTSQFIVYHTDKVWISYDEPSETWSVTMYINDFTSNLHANILHIHQLQHALSLAGVDKEINL